jgi:type IV pilus assembly protein PilQ
MINFCNSLKKCNLVLFVCFITLVLLAGCAAHREEKTPDKYEVSESFKVISAIETVQKNNEVIVSLKGSDNLTFTSVKQPFPTGVLLYFPNTKLKDVPDSFEFADGVVEAIKATEFGEGNKKVRIEILLRKDVGYRATKDGEDLLLSFKQDDIVNDYTSAYKPLMSDSFSTPETSKLDVGSVNYATLPYANEEPMIPVKMVSSNSKFVDENHNSNKVPGDGIEIGKTAWMNRIDFSNETDGKSTLIIGTTVPIRYEINKTAPTKVILKLLNTNIPKYRQRPLITTRFKSAVDRILPFQTPATKNESIVSVELREEVPYYVEQTDTILMIHFEPSSIPPRPLDESNLPDWQQVISQTTLESIPVTNTAEISEVQPSSNSLEETNISNNEFESETTYSQVYAAGEYGSKKKIYIGEKVALDFYKTDIKNVFRILREVSGKNFAIDKDVNGSVTLTLDKPVPWDQVLDLVLKMNQLGMIYEQDIIRIATLDTLRKEEDQRSAQLEAARKAKEQKESLEPLFTEYIPVNYSQAATEVMPHVQNILTKDRGSVTVDERNNQIIITDTKDVIKQAKVLVKRIDKVTPQVVIEARIVEVSNTFSRELGIEWGAEYGTTYSDVLDMDFDGNLAMDFPASSATSTIGFNFTRLDGLPFVLEAKINALESQGDGRILSSPKIVTLDNKKARIKQGLEYPYLERDDSGGSSVKFKDIDLLLEVTPHVTPDDRISLSIFITKNDVAGLTDGVPSIATNEAETELLVNDGDTIVIGGIIKASESGGETGFPGLSKIPLIGWLFKNENRSDSKNELLIFMTPRIVQLEQL